MNKYGWTVKECFQGIFTMEKWIGGPNGLIIAVTHHLEQDTVHMQVVSGIITKPISLESRKLDAICREADEKTIQILQETIIRHQLLIKELEEAAGYGD